jgi:hypothetical protein
VPIIIAFDPPSFQTTEFVIFDIFVDILFIVDMVLMFMTSFQDNKGQHITDQKEIAKNYMRTKRFIFDVLAILGTDVFSLINPVFKFFGLFKLTRI